MTNQVAAPHGATTTEHAPGGSISSLLAYAVSTLLVVIAVTGVALLVARDDPGAPALAGNRPGAATAARPTAQQLVAGVDPGIDVPAAIGLGAATQVGSSPLHGLQGDAAVAGGSAVATGPSPMLGLQRDVPVAVGSAVATGPSPLHGLQGDAAVAGGSAVATGPSPMHGLQGDAAVAGGSAVATGPSPMLGLQGDVPVAVGSQPVSAGSEPNTLWVSRHR